MEINKTDLDRIIITSNAQMEKIINWYQLNLDFIIEVTNDSMPLPMKHGLIRFLEEHIECEFHDKHNGGHVNFVVYMRNPDHEFESDDDGWRKIMSFDADLGSKRTDPVDYGRDILNLKFSPEYGSLMNVEKAFLTRLIEADNMFGKIIYKFYCIMAFMVLSEEIVEVDHSQDKPRARRAARAMKIRDQPLSLIRKTYVIKNFDENKVRIPGAPRKWTAPDHEVSVRGHYRHLKSGKVIWVRECKKFKEKGNTKPKTYKM